VAPPAARFEVAFNAATLDDTPTFTGLDSVVKVAEYTIDRGRTYELDRCDTGRATVYLNDTTGALDPTNSSSPYVGKIQPLKQARLAVWNPVVSDWYTRFRGFIESFEYEFDPSQRWSTSSSSSARPRCIRASSATPRRQRPRATSISTRHRTATSTACRSV
jgi:hypothetical protein